MSAEHCPELKMLPIQQWSLSSTFPKLLTQPPSPDPPTSPTFSLTTGASLAAVPCRGLPAPRGILARADQTLLQPIDLLCNSQQQYKPLLAKKRCLRCSKLTSQQDSIVVSLFGNMIGSDEKYNLSASRAPDDNITHAKRGYLRCSKLTPLYSVQR